MEPIWLTCSKYDCILLLDQGKTDFRGINLTHLISLSLTPNDDFFLVSGKEYLLFKRVILLI